MTNTAENWPTRLAWTACGLAAVCAVAALIAGPGYRMGWWTFPLGIQIVRWSATVALGVAAAGLLIALAAQLTHARRVVRVALLGTAVALAVAIPPIAFYLKAQSRPRIHDISTDTENPPAFVAIVPLRKDASNSTTYHVQTAVLQREGYPDIGPLVLRLEPEQAYARAESVVRSLGWTLVASSPADLRIEATDTTLLFGFRDDVAIRIAAHPDGSRIDVRSLSRVGGSDLGANASRIRSFMAKFAAEQH